MACDPNQRSTDQLVLAEQFPKLTSGRLNNYFVLPAIWQVLEGTAWPANGHTYGLACLSFLTPRAECITVNVIQSRAMGPSAVARYLALDDPNHCLWKAEGSNSHATTCRWV